MVVDLRVGGQSPLALHELEVVVHAPGPVAGEQDLRRQAGVSAAPIVGDGRSLRPRSLVLHPRRPERSTQSGASRCRPRRMPLSSHVVVQKYLAKSLLTSSRVQNVCQSRENVNVMPVSKKNKQLCKLL